MRFLPQIVFLLIICFTLTNSRKRHFDDDFILQDGNRRINSKYGATKRGSEPKNIRRSIIGYKGKKRIIQYDSSIPNKYKNLHLLYSASDNQETTKAKIVKSKQTTRAERKVQSKNYKNKVVSQTQSYIIDKTEKPEHKSRAGKSVENNMNKDIFSSQPQSPLVDMMRNIPTINYFQRKNTTGIRDPFDYLRDAYLLPSGYSMPLDEYDYVIVGAGSAGSALAARLSEDPKSMVLLIEAGKPEMMLSDIPALVPYLQFTNYTYKYNPEPQPGVCVGSMNQRCLWTRGKAVGGSSVTNYMIYSRGRPEDWNKIARDGNYGWKYDDIFQYFKKSERFKCRKSKYDVHRSRDGPLSVENVSFRTGLLEAFLSAGRALGHPTIDYNKPDQLGFGYVQTITDRGHRLSSARAYLHPHKKRKNLHILTEAFVTKIIIEPNVTRAYAVVFVTKGKKLKVRFRREVILSAGPIASPQLLMLSGVGPAEHLYDLGIPIIKELQVGRTLYDHIAFPGVVFKLNTTNASYLEPKVATLPNLMQWLQFGEGLLTSPGGIEGIGYVKTAKSLERGNIPDIELYSMGSSITADSGGVFVDSLGIAPQTYRSAFSSLDGLDTWSAIPVLAHPKSKGYLELRDRNPYSPPKIYANYLSDPSDMETLKEGVKYVIKLGLSDSFKKYHPLLHLGQYPACKIHPPGSDKYWECAIRSLMVSLNHQIGTCKMGKWSDPEAVVDPEMKVYGVSGLRVVGSSVLPHTMSGHSSAIGIMIAEKAADLIKATWANAETETDNPTTQKMNS